MSAIGPGETIFESEDGWKIRRYDSGMGEHEYYVSRNDEFYCNTPTAEIASEIIGAIRFSANMRNAEEREKAIRQDERNKVMDEYGILHGEDAKRFHEYMNSPEPLNPAAAQLVREARDRANKERKES